MRPVSVPNLLTPFANGLRPVVAEHRSLSAPVTDLLAVAVCAVYAAQAAQTVAWGTPSVFATTSRVYLRAPWLAWPLSPLLHGGLEHVVPNVLTLFAFGRVAESHLSTRRFAAMAALAAAGSIAALAAWGIAFGPGSNVAVYGISGVVFAAGGFALVHLPRHALATDLELLAVLFGACAAVLVGAQALGALLFASPAAVNVGHAAGLLVGAGVAAAGAGDCVRFDRDPDGERPRGNQPADGAAVTPTADGSNGSPPADGSTEDGAALAPRRRDPSEE